MTELTTLNALSQVLNQAEDVRDALEASLRHVVDMMQLNTGWIFLRDEHSIFRLVARYGLPPAIDYPGPAWNDSCDCQDMCNDGKLTKAVNMVRCSRLRYAIGDKRGLYQHASVPLLLGNELLGILNVATTEFGRFNPAQLQLLSTVGMMLGIAITRMRLNEQVKIRRVQEQAIILQLSQDLLESDAIGSALHRIARVGARLLEIEACAFVVADEAAGVARLVAAHGWRFLPASGLPAALDEQNPHLWYLPEKSHRLHEDALETLPKMLSAQKFRSHLSKDVSIGGVVVGQLMVNTRSHRSFSQDDEQLLAMLAAQAAQALERERLQQESNERQRLEQELDLASDIQASFLPERNPSVPGFEIAAFYRAARQVGGDFYDFIALERAADTPSGPRARWGKPSVSQPLDGRLGVVIADVTGKGVPAALFMVLSRTLLRASALSGRSPEAVLQFANRMLLEDARTGLFVTAFYGIIDPPSGTLSFASGGHCYPVLFRADSGRAQLLEAQGIVLGVVQEPRFEQRSIQLGYGDVLVLYTDGVTEAMNSRRQLFEDERLSQVLEAYHHLPPQQIVERITAAVSAFAGSTPQTDDITMIVIKRQPPSA